MGSLLEFTFVHVKWTSEQILFTDHEWRFGSQQEELQEEYGVTWTKPLKEQTLISVISHRQSNLGEEKMHVEDMV